MVVETHRVEDPRSSVPGGGIEDGPQVEEENGCDTAAFQGGLRVFLGLRDLDVCSDNPQADGAACGTDEQQVSSSDVVDQPQEPYEGDDSLDYAENTGCQQTSVGAGDTNALSMLLALCSTGEDDCSDNSP